MNTTSYISLLTNHLAFASKEDCTDEQRARIIKHVQQFTTYAEAGLIKHNGKQDMTAIERHRKAWKGKSDEWLFERLDNELKQKVKEIHWLLQENAVATSLLKDLYGLQNDAPLEKYRAEWEKTMEEISALIVGQERSNLHFGEY